MGVDEGFEPRRPRLPRRRESGLALAVVLLLAALVVSPALWHSPADLDGPTPVPKAGALAAHRAAGLPVGSLTAGEPVAQLLPARAVDARVTVRVSFAAPTDRWRVHLDRPWYGVSTIGRSDGSTASVGWLVAYGVTAVARCAPTPVAPRQVVRLTSLRPLLELPGAVALEQPRGTTLGGRPATHAVLRVVGCPDGRPHPVVIDRGYEVRTRGDLPAGRPIDVWHVPLPAAPGMSLLVVVDRRGDAALRREVRRLLASVEITLRRT